MAREESGHIVDAYELGLIFTDGQGTIHWVDGDVWSPEGVSPRSLELLRALLRIVQQKVGDA